MEKDTKKRMVLALIMGACIVIITIFFYKSCNKKLERPHQEHTETVKNTVSLQKIKEIFSQIYANNSYGVITPAESAFITKKGGNPTYGEIKPDSLSQLLKQLYITDKDILYDLGSGTGKVVIQSYLEFPFKKVVGIELSQQRYSQAQEAINQLKQLDLIDPNRVIQFIQGDIVETPYQDATLVYMCSTCFSDELMAQLAKKFSQMKQGTRIITLKSIADSEQYNLRLTQEHRLPMSWSENSPVYIYERY